MIIFLSLQITDEQLSLVFVTILDVPEQCLQKTTRPRLPEVLPLAVIIPILVIGSEAFSDDHRTSKFKRRLKTKNTYDQISVIRSKILKINKHCEGSCELLRQET